MDVFALRKRLVASYQAYTAGFLEIRDDEIRDYVRGEIGRGLLWPDPKVQLNPAFEPGPWIHELVADGTLHEEAGRIFRPKRDLHDTGTRTLRLHRHQTDAIAAAKRGCNYVLTTGTGSGKSLAYIVPIVGHVLRAGSGRGVQAIVVYPMNALANSQAGELEKFLHRGYAGGPPVTYARYTGQESREERQAIWADPPDIILTNYVMLELILTRPQERPLVAAAKGLRFLVLDELHTYRGRQGADVAMLARRVRDACRADRLQCVGTSATLASGGTQSEQQVEIVRVAGLLFGGPVTPSDVIGETLRRATRACDPHDEADRRALKVRVAEPAAAPPTDYAAFCADPLSRWLEHTFGVVEVEGRLVRRTPQAIWDEYGGAGAAQELAELTGEPRERCVEVIREGLLGGYQARQPETGWPAFAFRLHRFISKGDTVYATPEDPGERRITVHRQRFAPGDRKRVLLPLAFCRECGQDYYLVRAGSGHEGGRRFDGRDIGDTLEQEGSQAGFLYFSEDQPWPDDVHDALDVVPDWWLEEARGVTRVKSHYRRQLPKPVRVGADGTEDPPGPGPGSSRPRSGSAWREGSRTAAASDATSPNSPGLAPRAGRRRPPSCHWPLCRGSAPRPTPDSPRTRGSCCPSPTTGKTPACKRATSTTSSWSASSAPPCSRPRATRATRAWPTTCKDKGWGINPVKRGKRAATRAIAGYEATIDGRCPFTAQVLTQSRTARRAFT